MVKRKSQELGSVNALVPSFQAFNSACNRLRGQRNSRCVDGSESLVDSMPPSHSVAGGVAEPPLSCIVW